ncbi:Antibiotic biosynthesis monooxygenase [Chryseobacterium oranimense G311]|uniref:putative quinol monooxygenase n=1 Tax=Chryseobacterium oranimense TaxID=421058 RepID=UPI0005338AD4|nr:antibiotic biosynthesis monooxygenase [Chryseobacterium oranimense]CEJ68145.1 Antibiotic biosynthesis monooxygenase [Chryseobacterium oranimense G311]
MDEKIIILAEIPVKPEYFEEVKALCENTLKHTLQEKGCEAFYQTFKRDEPYTLVFFEIFSSQKSLDTHMNEDYTKTFFAGIKDKLSGKPTSSFLCEFR